MIKITKNQPKLTPKETSKSSKKKKKLWKFIEGNK